MLLGRGVASLLLKGWRVAILLLLGLRVSGLLLLVRRVSIRLLLLLVERLPARQLLLRLLLRRRPLTLLLPGAAKRRVALLRTLSLSKRLTEERHIARYRVRARRLPSRLRAGGRIPVPSTLTLGVVPNLGRRGSAHIGSGREGVRRLGVHGQTAAFWLGCLDRRTSSTGMHRLDDRRDVAPARLVVARRRLPRHCIGEERAVPLDALGAHDVSARARRLQEGVVRLA